jgi:signal peptidase II
LNRKWIIFGSIVGVVLTLDIVTKRWAVKTLSIAPSELLGGLIPLRLAYNRGAAFGISLGNDPRWFFIPITVIALLLLFYLLVQARDRDLLRVFSVSLVVSGAFGNLINRVFEPMGVIDFIGPIWIGFTNWPIFNVADMAISTGAVILAISFWQEEREEARAKQLDEADGSPESTAESTADPTREPTPGA